MHIFPLQKKFSGAYLYINLRTRLTNTYPKDFLTMYVSCLQTVGRQTDKQTADVFSSRDIETGMQRKSERVRKRDVKPSVFSTSMTQHVVMMILISMQNMYSLSFRKVRYFF